MRKRLTFLSRTVILGASSLPFSMPDKLRAISVLGKIRGNAPMRRLWAADCKRLPTRTIWVQQHPSSRDVTGDEDGDDHFVACQICLLLLLWLLISLCCRSSPANAAYISILLFWPFTPPPPHCHHHYCCGTIFGRLWSASE